MRPPLFLNEMRRNGANGVAGPGQVDVDRVLSVRVLPVEDRFEALDADVRELIEHFRWVAVVSYRSERGPIRSAAGCDLHHSAIRGNVRTTV
jgi:hypothetical protein